MHSQSLLADMLYEKILRIVSRAKFICVLQIGKMYQLYLHQADSRHLAVRHPVEVCRH